MSRKQHYFGHHIMSDSEEMRIRMYLAFGGFYYRTIAHRVYGNGDSRYQPSNAEIARVGKVARKNNMSSRDWRKGKSNIACRLLNRLGRMKQNAKPKLKIVA